jgi:4-hydroxybenzoate polyprenyltransferase
MHFPAVKLGEQRSPTWRERLGIYARLVRLDRPIGIFLLMWPALWALWIASAGNPPWLVVTVFVAGVVLMRSAGCAINDYADRELDGQVWRTRARPIAAGLVRPRRPLGCFILSLVAFALVLLLDRQTVALSVVALGLAVIYPFMSCHPPAPGLLGAASAGRCPWPSGHHVAVSPLACCCRRHGPRALIYDTQYAMVTGRTTKVGIKSTAILFGR